MSTIERFDTTDSYAQAAARIIAEGLSDILASRGRAVLAVPGGSTIRAVGPALARHALPWSRITVTLTDERWVPANHPDSNEALIRSVLAGPAADARIRGLYDSSASPECALGDLIAGQPAPDVILLGMGEDGHVVSLFPGDAANAAAETLAVVERPDHRRITITPRVISSARRVILATAGPSKEDALNRAMQPGDAAAMPVRHAISAGARILLGP